MNTLEILNIAKGLKDLKFDENKNEKSKYGKEEIVNYYLNNLFREINSNQKIINDLPHEIKVIIFKLCPSKYQLRIKIKQLENHISHLEQNYKLLKEIQLKYKVNTSNYNKTNRKIQAQKMQIDQFKSELNENYKVFNKQLF